MTEVRAATRTGEPDRIGPYEVMGRLGGGAMGTVHLARSPGGRLVAIKVVRSELAEDGRFRERFRREIAMARAVGGFWTAAVVDADPEAARPWLATEYVSGVDLRRAVRTHGPLPPDALRALAAGLAEALVAIHGAGLVHRDLKPSNVMVAPDGPRVIDFGISKALEDAALTATGVVVGTPGYLSPEQVEGRGIGPAADVFALGAVLLFAATGRDPFGEGDAAALLYRAVHTRPDLREVPPALRPLVSRCLNPKPRARPTAAEVLAEAGTRPKDDWLPPALRTLVDRRHAEVATERTPATRQYTEAAGGRRDNGNRAVFGTSRASAVVLGSVGAIAALVCGAWSAEASKVGQHGAALALFLAFVLLALSAARQAWRAVGPRRRVELSADGLAVTRGRRRVDLAWRDVARVRVVEDRRRPWLAVWPRDPALLSGHPEHHGGYRVFPVGHERRKRARLREIKELRAALAWYGRAAYDPSP